MTKLLLPWSVERLSREGDQRSDEVEKLLAIDCQKPDTQEMTETGTMAADMPRCECRSVFRLGIQDILFKHTPGDGGEHPVLPQ